jgi:lysylphosphatidylglycerol synthetase-like protein (DUF2156 family)
MMTKEQEMIKTYIEQFGTNTTSFQILNPGMSYWFSNSLSGAAGYVQKLGWCIVAGQPLCSNESMPKILEEIEKKKKKTCYFAVEDPFVNNAEWMKKRQKIAIGDQPAWYPKEWNIENNASLRYQLNRAKNKEVIVKEKNNIDPIRFQLETCLEEWIDQRPFFTLHYLTEPRILSQLTSRRVFVATQNEKIVAYLVLSPIPLKKGWLIEQIIRKKDAPNGTSELLVDTVMKVIAKEGYEYATMGLTPLSPSSEPLLSQNPPLTKKLFKFIQATTQSFYRFKGLALFKNKFNPHFRESIWIVTNQPNQNLSLYPALAAAFLTK